MDTRNSSTTVVVKKQEDGFDDSKGGEKRDVKPTVKPLNRVPRACNACRKQKMRCEGADNPPCRRCRNTGLECLFEKPSREATLTGEAGLERIRSLENHVADISHSQSNIQGGIAEILAHLRGSASFLPRSPTYFPPSFPRNSPSVQAISPSVATPTDSRAPHMNDLPKPSSGGTVSGVYTPNGPLPAIMNPSPQRQSRGPMPYRNLTLVTSSPGQTPGSNEFHPLTPSYPGYSATVPTYSSSSSHGPVLPPFSSIETMVSPGSQTVNTSARYLADGGQQQRQLSRHHNTLLIPSSKRIAPGSSDVPSPDSSDAEEDENGELPASGLVAPWEVLRGLADVAIQRAAKENGDVSEPQSRARTPDRQSRPTKRRKFRHKQRGPTFSDVVTKGIVTEFDARELFRIFYQGCSTFLPVFDINTDTYESLHERSPFAVDCICMVAARVRDGGGNPSDTYLKCLDEVRTISCATLFSPVTRNEAVQAMILVSGWSDNGWLSGGHAVRMAMELSMHKAWPKLYSRMNKGWDVTEDRELVIQSRIWFCLYLFEHQLSYGTGRPAILKEDESIFRCRLLLQHPLAIEDDMRLVSTVELMALREKINNKLAPFDRPVEDQTFDILREADLEFKNWYATWDQAFSQKYENAAFYRQSLQIQHLHAELFHNATALREIDGPDDVRKMHPAQRELAIRSIQIAQQGLDVTLNSAAYREGMKYAVHYTHATATFAASFLLRLARLFPEECNMHQIRTEVESLATLMLEIPGKRYALTLQVMLKRSKKRNATSRSPKVVHDLHQPMPVAMDSSAISSNTHGGVEPFSPTTYDPGFSGAEMAMHPTPLTVPSMTSHAMDAEYIWRGFEMTANAQLPVWLSDESLGGNTFSQNGMDAFLLPSDYLYPPPGTW